MLAHSIQQTGCATLTSSQTNSSRGVDLCPLGTAIVK